MTQDTQTNIEADALTASLTVGNLQASVAWYRDVVGFKVEKEMLHDGKLRAVRVSAGSVLLLLNQDDGAKGERKKGEGFSMMLQTRQNIDALARRVTDNGGKIESGPADMPWGARVFRVKDPDGFVYAVSSPIAG